MTRRASALTGTGQRFLGYPGRVGRHAVRWCCALSAAGLLAVSAGHAADLGPPELDLSSASVVQQGNGHYAVFEQADDTPRNQRISLQQSGDPHRATVSQTGSDNLITASQQGGSNLLDVLQSGRFNQIDIRQSGNNSATLRQIGTGNSATIAQAAGSAPLLLEQIGDGKVYSLVQH